MKEGRTWSDCSKLAPTMWGASLKTDINLLDHISQSTSISIHLQLTFTAFISAQCA